MARPPCCKKIGFSPNVIYFKPRGIPCSSLEEVVLTKDELEAVRLADLEALYQEEAAEKMGISRPTFGRIIESAHRKIAGALVNGKALRITGGNVEVVPSSFTSHMKRCRRRWRRGGKPWL
jgi:predicted DNA-binding protein (UPF0251 family)